jgi:U3 small nucleolar RNA-associated protein 11
MSANALRHVVRRRAHQERAQPAARARRFGLLEKHKDYKERAVDYHRKQDALQKMREKAAFRNEDEFYMNMNKAQTKNGVHVLHRESRLTPKTVKMMKAQDMAYLKAQQASDTRRIERAKENMHFLLEDPEADGKKPGDDDDDDEDQQPARKKTKTSSAAPGTRSKHVIFVDSSTAASSFTPSTYFQTPRELVGRTFNRLREEQLSEPVLVNNVSELKQAQREALPAAAAASSSSPLTALQKSVQQNRATVAAHALQAKADQSLLAGYSEIAARLKRKRKLTQAVEKLQMEKNMAGKGRRVPVTPKQTDKFGETSSKKKIYKWKQERKK